MEVRTLDVVDGAAEVTAVVVEHLVLEVVAEILADKLRVGHIFINFDDAAVFGVHAFMEQCAKDVDCFHFVCEF